MVRTQLRKPSHVSYIKVVGNFRWTVQYMNELKDKYKRDFVQLRTSMNEFDPCGLIALESPVDEYDYLTNKVLGLIHRKESRDKIKETILFELTDYFGEDIESYDESYKAKFYESLNKFLDEVQEIE